MYSSSGNQASQPRLKTLLHARMCASHVAQGGQLLPGCFSCRRGLLHGKPCVQQVCRLLLMTSYMLLVATSPL